MEPKDQIRAFLIANFYLADQAVIGDDDSLMELGIVDSTGVVELIAFIEHTFGVTIQNREVLPENLESIERIANFIVRKKE